MTETTLILGQNTYVTLEEAQQYITLHYPSTAPQNTAWQELNPSDQEIHLRNATSTIDNLRWAGKKCTPEQVLSFPRQRPASIQKNNFSKTFSETIEKDIKAAQIEEALERACPTEASDRKAILNQGIQSFQIGHLREHYSSHPSLNANTLAQVLHSLKAQEILTKHQGSYSIR